jgi:hypothetical protein
MASYNEFKADSTDVLLYKPRSHVQYRQGGRRFLLWPVYAYRVYAPKPKVRKLNVFQKAILGFCRAGQRKVEVIAKSLFLDVEVVRFVINELRHLSLLNPDYSLTSHGHTLLAEELDQLPTEIVMSYVFQDPWSGKLWPRITENLQYANIEYEGDTKYPTLLFGTKGSPRRHRPFVKRGDQDMVPRTPNALDILNASRQNEKDKRRSAEFLSGLGNTFEEDVTESNSVDGAELASVSVINEEPELFYLTTYIYIPDYELHSLEWYICDPFGFGSSPWLRRSFDQQAEKDSTLRDFRDGFLANALGDPQHYGDQFLALDLEAKREVRDRFTDAIELYPFFSQLVAMERAFNECLLYQSNCPDDKLGDVLVKAGVSLEGLFRYIHSQFPASDAWRVYTLPTWQARNSLLNEIALSLGFHTPLPKGLAGITPNEIRRACESGGGTLGERLVTLLLSARRQVEHPLRRNAAVNPDLFNQLSIIMKMRGLSAHDTNNEISIDLVLDLREKTYQIVHELLSTDSLMLGGQNV